MKTTHTALGKYIKSSVVVVLGGQLSSNAGLSAWPSGQLLKTYVSRKSVSQSTKEATSGTTAEMIFSLLADSLVYWVTLFQSRFSVVVTGASPQDTSMPIIA